MDDWAEIRHLFSTGKYSKREIARQIGVSRGTVDRALAEDRSPTYQRERSGSSFDAFAPKVRVLLAATPGCLLRQQRSGWAGRGQRRCSARRPHSCGRSMPCQIPQIGWSTRPGSKSRTAEVLGNSMTCPWLGYRCRLERQRATDKCFVVRPQKCPSGLQLSARCEHFGH